MTASAIVQNKSNTVADTIETFFTSPTGASQNGTQINAFTASNDTDTGHWYKAYIYDSTGVAVQAVIPLSIVVKGKADYGASIIGQVIPRGGTLRMQSTSTDGSFLNFYVTGAQL